jgi:hypothetical protein
MGKILTIYCNTKCLTVVLPEAHKNGGEGIQ